MLTSYEATLDCVHCGEATRHVLEYVAGLFAASRCERCGREVRKPRGWLRRSYLLDLRYRLVTKPWRLADEMRASLPLFLLRAPRRAATKPFRMLGEVVDLRLPEAS